MRYAEYAPSPRLTPYVRCYWTFESGATPGGAAERIVPDGRPELIFHLADPFERLDERGLVATQHRAVFVGQIERALTVRPTGRAGIFAVRFRPAGAAAVLGEAARNVAGLSVPLDALWRGGHAVAERVIAAAGDAARVAIVEDALLERLAPPRSAALAQAAVERIVERRGILRLGDLAAELGASLRTVERAFDEAVGVSPKCLARIVRFRRALALLETPRRAPFAAVAHDCGYADQSHLVRDFTEFAGVPPTAYLAADRPMSGHFAADT